MTIAGPNSLKSTNGAQPLDYLNSFLSNQNEEGVALDGGRKLSKDEENLLNDSGYRVTPVGRTSYDDENEQQKKKFNTEQAIANAIERQVMSYGGFEYTYDMVMNNLSRGTEQMGAFLSRDLPTVDRNSLLYVNENGQRVSADAPGARPIATIEEKRAFEARDKACALGTTAEEITKDANGNVVYTKDFILKLAVEEQKQEVEQIQQDIKSGRLKLEDLSEPQKKLVEQIERTGEIKAIKPDADMTVLDILNQQGARNEMIESYQQRHGTQPGQAFNPFMSPNPPTTPQS